MPIQVMEVFFLLAMARLPFLKWAAICGLEHISKEKRNPLALTTQGVGELIVHLVQSGVRDFIIGVGGSATNDGGIGMAYGLGYRFYDSEGQELEPIGANLGLIKKVFSKNKLDLSGVTIRLITDVDNPCVVHMERPIFLVDKKACLLHNLKKLTKIWLNSTKLCS